MQKLERCLLFLLYLSLLARGAQREGNKRERSYYDQQIAFYQTLCSEMHNEKVRKYSVQCDCSSKWKEGAGSWRGSCVASLFLCARFHGCSGVGFYEGWSNTGIECSPLCSTGPKAILTAGVEVKTESDGYTVLNQ